jgi:hypothetical protein
MHRQTINRLLMQQLVQTVWPVLLKYLDRHVTVVMSDTCTINVL